MYVPVSRISNLNTKGYAKERLRDKKWMNLILSLQSPDSSMLVQQHPPRSESE